ncbi:MAG: aminopeptidase [Eubacteriales bacterium]|nr:aminopeptidase [Lachnospiraceae bacterium]MDO5126506.1 aminopeptidase [Eubacteriales bacterium]
MERINAWTTYDENQLSELEEICKGYRNFLDAGKTERTCVKEIIRQAQAHGYRELSALAKEKTVLKAGDKVYRVCMNKTVVMFEIGEKPLSEGMNILGAHIDSPRLDVKQNPLYENGDFAYLDTHYYGGIKKYQWVALPLAMYGVICKKNGEVVEVAIGDKEDDPVFFVSDLLIHLAQEQMEKKANKVIEGENLDIVFGNKKLDGKDKDAVKDGVLQILRSMYDMSEEDFLSAELEIVPAGAARDAGIDRSMIMAYGQDDRVCAYTSLLAMLTQPAGEKTTCCLLTDKEEIGSVGATGMRSMFFENSVCELMDAMGCFSELALRRCLSNSSMLSSDVNAAYDPMFASAFDKNNASYFGRGMVFSKFTGSRGKSGSNDANAEYIARIRRIMDDNHICYQTAELGKVDVGGGGTIAYILSLYGMEVIDCGVAVLNMHAPWEVTSKADVYEAVKGYRVFLRHA